MVLAPYVVGATLTGWEWVHLPLGLTWLVGYFFFNAASLWLTSRFKARYRPPVLAYGAVTAALGLVVLAMQPRLAAWVLGFAPVLGYGWYAAWSRSAREVLPGLATVAAACGMCLVAADAGGSVTGRVLVAAAVLFWYFGGTVLYVKSCIRQRGSVAYLTASVAWHAAGVVGAGLLSGGWVLLAGALTLRAAVVPSLRATPLQLGIGEIVATLAVVVGLAL